MKKMVFYFCLFSFLQILNTQEPLVKIYIEDGSFISNNIEDIDNFNFIKSNLSYSLCIFINHQNQPIIHDLRNIDSIWFENNVKMNIVQLNTTNSYTISEIDSIIFKFNECDEIQIGTQVWMCKNLDVDHYRNGDSIPEIRDPDEWANLTTGAWCYYDNDPENGKIYGKLYNWYAVNDPRGLAPGGWHVPSDTDWRELEMFLGMTDYGVDYFGWIGSNQGSMLAGNYDLWRDGDLRNNEAFGTSGFNALPGDDRFCLNGEFGDIVCYYGVWWSASEYDSSEAIDRTLFCFTSRVYRYYRSKREGSSVRCVKD